MESETAEAILQREKKKAAIRERVRKFREKNNPKIHGPSPAPIPGKERIRQYRIRKQQQAIETSVEPPIVSPSPRVQVTKSWERMRKYRQNVRRNSGYQRKISLSGKERSRRWYAQKRQTHLQGRYSRLLSYGIGSEIGEDTLDAAAVARLQELRRKSYLDWPRLSGASLDLKEEILIAALQRVKSQIRSRGKNPAAGGKGLQLDWNVQLYTFLKLQIKAEREWRRAELNRLSTDPITKKKTRKDLALLVAKAGGWGTPVMNRILQQEVVYIRSGKLPAPKQGRHVKCVSWLSDEGTMLAIREYISLAGEGKTDIPLFN